VAERERENKRKRQNHLRERRKRERKDRLIRATDGLVCVILHLGLMMMMMRKRNTHGAMNAALLVSNFLRFHRANNPGQTRMFDKERESTHRQLNSFNAEGLLPGHWCRTNGILANNVLNKTKMQQPVVMAPTCSSDKVTAGSTKQNFTH